MARSPKWLTVSQAGKLADVSVPTIRRWCDLLNLPHERTPGTQQRVIAEEALHAFLAKRAAKRSEARA